MSLFVRDEEMEIEEEILEVPDDDPVVEEIPVYLNSPEKEVLVLQYPTRKKNERSNGQLASKFRIKPTTGVVEVDIMNDMPYELTDSEKQIRWDNLSAQTFGGMLRPSNGRYGLGTLHNNELHITLVSKTAQLRPQFDHFNRQTKEDKAASMILKDEQKDKTLRAVQMTAKVSSENVNRYSEVIDYWKNVAEEDFVNYTPCERSEDESNVLITENREPIPGDRFDLNVDFH